MIKIDNFHSEITASCSICGEVIKLDKHHIWSLSLGGPNKLWNVCYICPNCHRKIHTGNLIVEGWFFTLAGRTLLYRNKNEVSVSGKKDYPVWIYPDYEDGIKNPNNFFFKNILSFLSLSADKLEIPFQKSKCQLKVIDSVKEVYWNVCYFLFDEKSTNILMEKSANKFFELFNTYLNANYHIIKSNTIGDVSFPSIISKKFAYSSYQVSIRFFITNTIRIRFLLKEVK